MSRGKNLAALVRIKSVPYSHRKMDEATASLKYTMRIFLGVPASDALAVRDITLKRKS